MKLLVTGASSFLGAHFCLTAAQRHQVYGLHFNTPLRLPHINAIKGDLQQEKTIEKLKGLNVDAIVHLAAKIKANSNANQTALDVNRAMMNAVLALQKPVLYASSAVVHWDSNCQYAYSRREDERRLNDSRLPYAILRPSAPYGPRLLCHQPGHKESFHTLVAFIRHSPLVPMVGNGKYTRQPLHVEDFALAGLALLENKLQNQAYDIGGSTRLTMREIISTISHKMGKRRVVLPIPKRLIAQIAKRHPNFESELIDDIDSNEMIDNMRLTEATGLMPRAFEDGVGDLIA